jgi:hypothetical protein
MEVGSVQLAEQDKCCHEDEQDNRESRRSPLTSDVSSLGELSLPPLIWAGTGWF